MQTDPSLRACQELRSSGVPYFISGKIFAALFWRLYAVRLCFSGELSPAGTFRFIFLPTRYRRREIEAVNKGINAHTEKYFQKNNFYKQKTISLFSYPVAPSSNTTTGWLELLVHIQQIIVADQYSIGELVGRDSVIFDIGANVGIFSIGAARKATGGKIFSFEPGAATYAVLKQNMDPYPNVATYHYALGDSSGEQTLFTPGYESAMASLDRDFAVLYKKDAPVKTEKVTVRTVDDMADELKLKKLDLIKIDAEGSEMKILRGSSRTIASFHPIIVVSAYHRAEDRQEIPDFIKRIDPKYKTKLMDSAEEDFVFIPAR